MDDEVKDTSGEIGESSQISMSQYSVNSKFQTSNSKLLFTAFEPSGDDLAAPVIADIKRRCPELQIYALGGEKMQSAGAQLLENSCSKPVMMLGAIKEIFTHKARIARLKKWVKENQPAVVVPVDSPAANWSVCKLARSCGAQSKIVHLAAPQIWAWARWRINKLRRLTDKVLCLLPFEPVWFEAQNVEAVFVGHPIFEKQTFEQNSGHQKDNAQINIAVLPGSRSAEIKNNWPKIIKAIEQLRQRNIKLSATIFSANPKITSTIVSLCSENKLPTWAKIVQTDTQPLKQELANCDIALSVSGTVTLECVATGIPLVTLYKVNWLSWNFVGRWLVKTRTFTLPNLTNIGKNIAQDENIKTNIDRQLSSCAPKPIPELVPWFGSVDELATAIAKLAKDENSQQKQREIFAQINQTYAQKDFTKAAAQEILGFLEH